MQEKDIPVAAEKFNHSIKSFSCPYQHDNDDQPVPDSSVVQNPSINEKKEEPNQAKPFKEFNLGGKRKKGNGTGSELRNGD